MAGKGLAASTIAVGGIFLWSALYNKTITQTIQDLVTGQKPVAGPPQQGSYKPAPSAGTSGSGAGEGSGGPAAPPDPSGNTALAKQMAAKRGWTGTQWDALYNLWTRESGFNNRIWNGGSTADTQPPGSSGAYGIAQSLPYTKYPKAGWPPGYGGQADPAAQIGWGLDYISGRYGDPITAWAHEQSAGWY